MSKELALHLVDSGIVPRAALARALAEGVAEDRSPCRTMVRLGLIDEDAVIEGARSLGDPPVAPDEALRLPPARLCERIPRDLARRLHCVPFAISEVGALKVAFSLAFHPNDADWLANFLGQPIEPYLAAPNALRQGLARAFGIAAARKDRPNIPLPTDPLPADSTESGFGFPRWTARVMPSQSGFAGSLPVGLPVPVGGGSPGGSQRISLGISSGAPGSSAPAIALGVPLNLTPSNAPLSRRGPSDPLGARPSSDAPPVTGLAPVRVGPPRPRAGVIPAAGRGGGLAAPPIGGDTPRPSRPSPVAVLNPNPSGGTIPEPPRRSTSNSAPMEPLGVGAPPPLPSRTGANVLPGGRVSAQPLALTPLGGPTPAGSGAYGRVPSAPPQPAASGRVPSVPPPPPSAGRIPSAPPLAGGPSATGVPVGLSRPTVPPKGPDEDIDRMVESRWGSAEPIRARFEPLDNLGDGEEPPAPPSKKTRPPAPPPEATLPPTWVTGAARVQPVAGDHARAPTLAQMTPAVGPKAPPASEVAAIAEVRAVGVGASSPAEGGWDAVDLGEAITLPPQPIEPASPAEGLRVSGVRAAAPAESTGYFDVRGLAAAKAGGVAPEPAEAPLDIADHVSSVKPSVPPSPPATSAEPPPPPPAAPRKAEAVDATPPDEDRLSVEMAKLDEQMQTIEERDKLIDAVFGLCQALGMRGVFMSVMPKEKKARGVRMTGDALPPAAVKEIVLDTSLISAVGHAVRALEPFLGQPHDDELVGQIIAKLGGAKPTKVAIIPIEVREKAIALLYVDDADAPPLPLDHGSAKRLKKNLSAAFQTLILSKKLLGG